MEAIAVGRQREIGKRRLGALLNENEIEEIGVGVGVGVGAGVLGKEKRNEGVRETRQDCVTITTANTRFQYRKTKMGDGGGRRVKKG